MRYRTKISSKIVLDLCHIPLYLQIFITAQRCNENYEKCITLPTIKMKKICSLLALSKPMWKEFIRKTEPPFRCPIKPGRYNFKNATLDIGFITTAGSFKRGTIKANFRFFTGQGKNRKELMCINNDIYFTE